MLLGWVNLLADANDPGKTPSAFDPVFLLIMFIPLVLFIILPMRRDARVRKELMNSLKVGDWVMINGTMVAKVLQIGKADKRVGEDVVVVKLDENANVKATFLRSSVTRILKSDESAAKDGA